MTNPNRSVIVVRRQIARGGFGIVEEVELSDGTTAARKTFDPHPGFAHDADLVNKARKRFVREVSVQAQISHPHVVPVLIQDLRDDPPWFVMPYASRSLEDELDDARAAGDIPLEALVQMLGGLEELHRLGFVHRDLKPQNVLRIEGRWMLSDLGLVLPPSSTTTTLTGTNSAWGTQAYAAPEVITAFHTVTPAADIFSVGCILHDLASPGPRIPYGQCSAPGPLGLIIEKCTAPRPSQRFADVASLRSTLVARLSTTAAAPASSEVIRLDQRLVADPAALTVDDWLEIGRIVDTEFAEMDAQALLYSLDSPHLRRCFQIAPAAFARIAATVCRWVREATFDFVFCDVLGARLATIFELGGTRERAEAALGALILGESHNRWTVMRLFFRLGGRALDDDAAERLAIEILSLGPRAEFLVARCESTIRVSRTALHPRLQDALERVASDVT